jgi:hypothetical protein
MEMETKCTGQLNDPDEWVKNDIKILRNTTWDDTSEILINTMGVKNDTSNS